MTCSAELPLLTRSLRGPQGGGSPVRWLVKFWVVVALIPFWGAVIAALLRRLRGDSKFERLARRRGNRARGEAALKAI